MLASKIRTFCNGLRCYFTSGWAWLIPYLLVYLLYAWQKWPANPASRMGAEQTSVGDERISIPSLLHIYWAMHVINLLLGAATLSIWWRHLMRSTGTLAVLKTIIPWVCIAILIWVPGLYMEFPSDGIAHMGRILEWSNVSQLRDHSAWNKASYFLGYSFATVGSDETSAILVRAYYTGICLLLCWQTYRLGIALRLSPPAAMLFVLLQLVAFGNGAFSYHRYYGLSSTVVCHFAVLEILRRSLPSTDRFSAMGRLKTVLAAASLLLLIVFSHVQGLLLASVGMVALGLFRLSLTRPQVLYSVLALLAIASLLIVQYADGSTLHSGGWLNAWNSFDLLNSSSAAHHRAFEVAGSFGLISGALGLTMFFAKHPGAWLMTIPWALLLIPATAYPFALYLNGDLFDIRTNFHGVGLEYLSVFSRELFVVPVALPFAWVYDRILQNLRYRHYAITVPIGALALLLGQSTTGYSYNRLWQALARTPEDLELKPVRAVVDTVRQLTDDQVESKVLAAPGVGYFLVQSGVRGVPYERKQLTYPTITSPAEIQRALRAYIEGYSRTKELTLVALQTSLFYTPASQAALASGHWLPSEAALNLVGSKDLAQLGRDNGFRLEGSGPDVEVWTNAPESRLRSQAQRDPLLKQ